jgi:hypothetical protein
MEHWPDWEGAQERMKAWWAGEDLGRPGLYLAVPSDTQTPWPPTPPTPRRRWLDASYRIERLEAICRNQVFLAEGYPYEYPFPMLPAGYMGGEVVFTYETVWHVPFVEDWGGFEPSLGMDSQLWEATVRLVEEMARASRGRWITAMMTIGAPFDIMAALRGTARLCLDFYDYRGQLQRVRDRLVELWPQWYDALHAVIASYGQRGSSSWLSLWAPGKMYTLQEDFAALVGPHDFRDLLLPGLLGLARHLDYNLFHLDGPGAVVHLKTLLAASEIMGIQWVPGAGQPGPARWPELLRHIAGAGKKIHLSCSAEELLEVIEIVPHRLLFARVSGLSSRAEAAGFIRELEARCRVPKRFALPPLEEPYEGEAWQTPQRRLRSRLLER